MLACFWVAQSAEAAEYTDCISASVLDMTQIIWWWGPSYARALGNVKYPFIVIAPRSILAQSGRTWYGPIELFDI